MKKPRILIYMHYMAIGGAERSLLGLLNELDVERVDIDLFLNYHNGEFMPLIPKKINLLSEEKHYKALETHIKDAFKDGCWGVASSRVLSKVVKYLYFKKHKDEKDDDGYITAKLAVRFLPQINPNVEYDLAISFLTPHVNCLNKVWAKRKVAWIHTDYSTLKMTKNIVLPYWKQYDNIISISTDVTKTFVEVFPSLKDKIIEIENILSTVFIRQQAELFDVCNEMPLLNNDKCLNIISIGRFCYQKNFENIPFIASKLLDYLSIGRNDFAKKDDNQPNNTRSVVEYEFTDLRWYLIGFGSDETLIRQKIAEAGMENHIIIIGKKDNPYPYIKACDLYVQPSRYEGKSVTVREAQILCKPVIVTNYPTSKSQIKDGIDGIIVPLDNDACARGIADAISNPRLIKSIIKYLQTHDYGNECEVDKIYSLL